MFIADNQVVFVIDVSAVKGRVTALVGDEFKEFVVPTNTVDYFLRECKP